MSSPDIYELLHSSPEVEAIVGDRIFPLIQSGGVYPSVVYTLVSTYRSETYCGDCRLVAGSYQVDVYDRDYRQVIDVADAAREYLLELPKGTVIAGTKIRHCKLQTESENVDVDPGLFRRTQQWDIWYEDRS